MNMVQLKQKEIKEAVQAYEIQRERQMAELFSSHEMKNMRAAAVIIPLLMQDGEWHVLLTHRSEALVEHRGQVAFPGGAREAKDEDLRSTALREMHEEIGVDPEDVVVFGNLGDMSIITGYTVRPFVGQIPWPYELKLSDEEVESAFVVPLDWLVDPDHRTVEYRSYAGREFPVIFFDHFEGHQLWGASAEMMLALLSALDLID